MIIAVSLLVCIIGLIIYLATEKPKPGQLALMAYFAGLLAFLLQLSPQVIALLGK